MSNPLSKLILLAAPLVAIAKLGTTTARDAGRWFDEADEVWEPFLIDDGPTATPSGLGRTAA